MFPWVIIVTNDFQKFEGAGVRRCVPCAERAECLADRSILMASGNGDQHARRMIAERRRKNSLLLCRATRRREVGGAKMRDELRRKRVDHRPVFKFTRVDDLR